ncbi:MAG TPA: sensor domain-containing diguanylate cyclase [Solirubrobacteraceae bacterium]|nr:sensor domain-containing diguanylate cyclase [Solirubrobacteraceae bacterium]
MRSAGEIRPEERVVAGHAGAVVWLIASLSVIAMALALPGAQVHRDTVLAMGVGGCLWAGLSGLFLDYRRLPVWLIHLSTMAGVVAIAIAMSLSGGARSPAWACLFYVVVFAAYFFKPRAAAAYFLACVIADVIALVAGTAGAGADGTATLVIAAPAFIVLGVAIVVGKRFLFRVRHQAERLAAEQGALRRVATAVVTGEPADRFYQIVAVEAGQLLAAGAAAILRLDPEQATILGSWAQSADRQYRVGNAFPLAPDSDLARALAAARPVRVEQVTVRSSLEKLGYGSSIVAPIQVAGRTWGFLAVASVGARVFESEHERRLTEFAALISTAITNIEDRAALTAQASTDALTGVANHRAFYERLTADISRARRYGSPLSVAMIDVDRFKLVNDAGGHEAGDDILVRVARWLSDATRAEDILARVGGDEFAWILPETVGEEAVLAVERARRAMAQSGDEPHVTLSVGICDTRYTADPTELVRLADRALYSSKENGRDQVRLYTPASCDELAAT